MARLLGLRGGVAVITGAGAGLGAALARRAAALGMRLVLADIDAGAIDALAAELKAQDVHVIAVPTDVADRVAVDALAVETYRTFGSVRLLINNAAIETLGHAWDVTSERWQQTLAVNLLGPIHAVGAFVPRMVEAGEQAFIANVGSLGSLLSMPIQSAYITSKHALLAFTECLSLDLQMTGSPITISVVLPGTLATGIFDKTNSGNAAVEEHRSMMQKMLADDGMSVDEAATRIIEGIVSGRFWVSSHPDQMAHLAKVRGDFLAKLGSPEISGSITANSVKIA